MKAYRVYQVDSFTKDRFHGNPAGVVSNAEGLTDEQMQRIARELNNSETAFILEADSSNYDVEVRFSPLQQKFLSAVMPQSRLIMFWQRRNVRQVEQ